MMSLIRRFFYRRPKDKPHVSALVKELEQARKQHRPVKPILRKLHEARFGGNM